MKRLFFLALIVTFFAGCDSKSPEPVDEYAYFPLRLNAPRSYQVTQTTYAAGQSEPVITTWQEKDEVIRINTGTDGFPVYVLARSTRSTPTAYWQKVKEYTVTRYPDKLLLSLDNKTTIPMVFPITTGVLWNLNQYNTSEEEKCRYADIKTPRTIGDFTFPNTIQVSGREFTQDIFVRYHLGFSQYALGVGLIYEEQTDYYYCQEDHCLGQQLIASGTSTIRQLIDYPEATAP